MKRNPLLYLALLFSKAIRVVLFLGLVLLVIIFIHWHLNPGYYKSVQVAVDNGSIFFFEGKTETAKPVPHLPNNSYLPGGVSGKRVYLNDLNPFSFYFTFFQLFLSILLSYFIMQEVIRLLKSVQESQPFNAANIRSFRRLGYLCLSITVLNSLHFLYTNQTSFVSFSINYTLLIFMLITFILAEIFREGQKLYEQEKLTI